MREAIADPVASVGTLSNPASLERLAALAGGHDPYHDAPDRSGAAKVHTREVAKRDGRYLIYYTFDDEPDRAAARRRSAEGDRDV
jgi:hypothetical protein